MANGPRYRVPLRRRREGKTNYYLRRELLKSGKTRLVIRRSTKHMRVQFINSFPDGDKTLSDSSSYQLEKYGWKLKGGNIPAAYLTGYLAGKKAVANGIQDAILDLGLQTNQQGSRIYAALKGIIDAGIEIPSAESIFPEEDIINGSHILKASKSINEMDEKEYKKQFSSYVANKIKPDKLPNHVKKTKNSIDGKLGGKRDE